MNFEMCERDRLINRLIVASASKPHDIGLLTGQMGSLITIALYARKFDAPWLDEVCDFLFTNISDQVTRRMNMTFESGMAGVGWGVEFLVQESIMPGPGDTICKSIDKAIMRFDIRQISDMSIEKGLPGIWKYVRCRLKGNYEWHLPAPFNSIYLNEWKCAIGKNPVLYDSDSLAILDLWDNCRDHRLTPLSLNEIMPLHKTSCPSDISLSRDIIYKYGLI